LLNPSHTLFLLVNKPTNQTVAYFPKYPDSPSKAPTKMTSDKTTFDLVMNDPPCRYRNGQHKLARYCNYNSFSLNVHAWFPNNYLPPYQVQRQPQKKLVLPIISWLYQQINPSLIQFSWCAHARYPYWCSEDDEECSYERGQLDKGSMYLKIVNMNILVVPMVGIIWYVYSQERLLKSYMKANNSTSPGNQRRLSTFSNDTQYTKEVVLQALMYSCIVRSLAPSIIECCCKTTSWCTL